MNAASLLGGGRSSARARGIASENYVRSWAFRMALARQHYLERVVFVGGAEDVVGLLDLVKREVVGA